MYINANQQYQHAETHDPAIIVIYQPHKVLGKANAMNMEQKNKAVETTVLQNHS